MNKAIFPTPKLLWLLAMTYTIIIIYANIFEIRLLSYAGIIISGGSFIFPLSFLIANCVTEVYGYKQTRRMIWLAFCFNILFLGYGQFLRLFAIPEFYSSKGQAFDLIITFNIRVLIASMISYLCSETINSYIVAKLKLFMNGKYLGARFTLSLLFASTIDTLIFTIMAFYKVIGAKELWRLLISMYFLKISIELIFMPAAIIIAKKLKSSEKLDIYDNDTDFTIFNLNATYDKDSNHYLKP